MELATLEVKVNASGAIRETERLSTALKASERAAVSAEAAQTGLGQSLVRLSRAERDAHSEAQRLTASARDVARQMSAYQQSVTLADAGLRRVAAAEREAYRDAGKLAAAQRQAALEAHKMAAAEQEAAASARALHQQQTLAAGTLTQLVQVAVAFGALRYGKQLLDMADSAKLLSARLSLVTINTADLARVQAALFTSAQRTRTSYEDIVTLYARVARNATALGKSQSELLAFTELVSMQLQISGASASEASSGVLQLSQALGKGKLDGEEFRTIMESMPTVADALAKSLGVPKAALFALSAQGKLTGAAIVDAMLKMEESTRASFDRIPRTISGAFVQMKNDILKTVGEIDAGVGGSSFFAKLIAGLPSAVGRATSVMTGGLSDLAMNALRGNGAAGVGANGATVGTGTVSELPAFMLADERERKRRADWAEQRKNAAEKKAWDDAEILRLGRIEDAAHRANLARLGRGLPGIGITGFTSLADTSINALGQRVQTRNSVVTGATVAGGFQGTFANGARISGTSVVGQGAEAAQAAQKYREEMDAASVAIAANFRENIQRSLGDFFTQFISTGKVSVSSIFNALRDIGARTLGEMLSGAVTKAIGKLDLGMGDTAALVVGASVFGALMDGVNGAAKAAKKLQAAMDATARSIADFASLAANGTMSPQESEIAGLRRTSRDLGLAAISRTPYAAGIAGLTGNTGTDIPLLEQKLAGLRALPQLPQIVQAENAIADLIKQFQALSAATEENISAVRKQSLLATAATVGDFGRGLSLSAASPLAPTAQLRAARDQYSALLSRALAGDQSAADQFGSAGNQLLSLSRSVNASGGRYVADFNTVKSDALKIEALFKDRASVAEDTRNAAQDTANNTGATNEILGSGFQTLVESIDILTERFDDLVRLQRETLAT